MNDRISVQREAVRGALQLRRSLSIPREHAINVFDLAASIGVEVQFLDLPSLEGMFYRGPDPKIILPSLKHRPRGRVAFSCAHEVGHFNLGHGTRVDKYLGDSEVPAHESTLEEVAADTFASTILMPRPAVLDRFLCRGWTVETASPIDLYRVACELDVGFGALLKHIRYGLGLVDDRWLKSRDRVAPKTLRREIAPRSDCSRVVIVDQFWPNVPVDLEVGDCVAIATPARVELPVSLMEEYEHGGRRVYGAAAPGERKCAVDGNVVTIRIARTGYCGFLKYRYLEEGDEE